MSLKGTMRILLGRLLDLASPRLSVLAASGAAALLGAFFLVPDRHVLSAVSHGGYWFVLSGFVGWVWSVRRTFSEDFRSWSWRRVDFYAAASVFVGGVVLLVHEVFGFKIVMDELMLLGTSMSMHLDRIALTPVRGNDIQGEFQILQGLVDKRPLFFPFLLSLLHDISGYRPENAFVLNGFLTFVFLGLVWSFGRRLAGRSGGLLGVLLFAGLPLLGQNATGGGFELLNIVMILSTLLLGIRFFERRDSAALAAFVFSAVLLAQVRYESAIFLAPVLCTILWVWFREGRAEVPWVVVVAPLLLVPVPLQQRIFDLRASAWEMASKPGSTEPFSLYYVPENLGHAVAFFFGRAADQPNSPTLSAIGLVGVVFLVILILRRLRTGWVGDAAGKVTVLFGVGFALHFGLMMCYFWGKFDDPVIRRLSLPVHLGLVAAVLVVLPELRDGRLRRALLVLAGMAVLVRGVPAMAAHAYTQQYTPGRETAWRREFMAAMPRPDYLMIDNDAPLWVTHRVSATPTTVAAKRQEDIAFHLRNRTFSDVFVFQRFNVSPDTGALTLREGDDLGPDYVLEPVAERRLHLLTLSRISRVREIRQAGQWLSAPDTVKAAVPLSAEEIKQARLRFLESYLKRLP